MPGEGGRVHALSSQVLLCCPAPDDRPQLRRSAHDHKVIMGPAAHGTLHGWHWGIRVVTRHHSPVGPDARCRHQHRPARGRSLGACTRCGRCGQTWTPFWTWRAPPLTGSRVGVAVGWQVGRCACGYMRAQDCRIQERRGPVMRTGASCCTTSGTSPRDPRAPHTQRRHSMPVITAHAQYQACGCPSP
jgi:hypothetical protein